eukprot:218422_1
MDTQSIMGPGFEGSGDAPNSHTVVMTPATRLIAFGIFCGVLLTLVIQILSLVVWKMYHLISQTAGAKGYSFTRAKTEDSCSDEEELSHRLQKIQKKNKLK